MSDIFRAFGEFCGEYLICRSLTCSIFGVAMLNYFNKSCDVQSWLRYIYYAAFDIG